MPIEEKKKKVEQCICHSILCAFSQKVQAWDKKGNKKNLKKKRKKGVSWAAVFQRECLM